MELDELKAAWRAIDARIEAGHALNVKIFEELKLEQARSALRPLWWFLTMEIGIALGAVVLLGAFLADYWRMPRFAVPAIVLDVVAVLLVASAVGQLWRLSTIDYAKPVVEMQRVLTQLAVRRVRDVRWMWLLMLPLWVPLAIVVAQGIFGFDVYERFGPGWVAANIAFGIGATPFMVWLVRRRDARVRREGIVAGLIDDIAGRRLSEAMRRVDEVVVFEKDV